MIKIISNGGRRLLWEVCLDLKKRGFLFLDLASVNMENPKTANIAKFKMSFGGDIMKEYAYMYQSDFYKLFSNYFNPSLIFRKIVNKIKNGVR
jgi:hypothetical protein